MARPKREVVSEKYVVGGGTSLRTSYAFSVIEKMYNSGKFDDTLTDEEKECFLVVLNAGPLGYRSDR